MRSTFLPSDVNQPQTSRTIVWIGSAWAGCVMRNVSSPYSVGDSWSSSPSSEHSWVRKSTRRPADWRYRTPGPHPCSDRRSSATTRANTSSAPVAGSTTASTPAPTSATTSVGETSASTTSGAIVTGRTASTVGHSRVESPATSTNDTFWIEASQTARSASQALAEGHPAASRQVATPVDSQISLGPTNSTGWSGLI